MGRPRDTTSPARIVQAGADLFERQGYQNTTIDDIAKRAKLSKPTVYQHVKSKSDILERIFQDIVDRAEGGFARGLAGVTDPLVAFDTVIRVAIKVVTDSTAHFRVFFEESKELPPTGQRRLREWRRDFVARVRTILEDSVEAGLMHPQPDPHVASHLIVSMLTALSQWYDPRGELTPDEVSDQVLLLLRGYLTDAGQAELARILDSQEAA